MTASLVASSGNEALPTIPVICVANCDEHVDYVAGVLDEHVLRALNAPGHKLHEDRLEQGVTEAFPRLCCLAMSGFDSQDDMAAGELDALDVDDDAADMMD